MKKRWIVLFIIVGGILLMTLLIVLGTLFMDSLPESKRHKKFIEEFDLELKGEIIDIKADRGLRIACLKVENSNYKEYRMEDNRFFIRVKDSLAVMIYYTKHIDKPRHHLYEVGSELLINHNNNKQIIELKERDTIDIYGIATYPIRDYLKNSCIPN